MNELKEIELLLKFAGYEILVADDGDLYIEDDYDENSIDDYFYSNTERVLFKCQCELLDKNWVISHSKSRIEVFKGFSNDVYSDFYYKDNNKDKIETFRKVIIYIINQINYK